MGLTNSQKAFFNIFPAGSFTGRAEIYTGEEELNEATIPEILNKAYSLHLNNAKEIRYLLDYYKGSQDILRREKSDIRADIKHNTVINYALYVVRESVGYFFSQPLQYTLRNIKKQDEFDEFKLLSSSEEKASKDIQVAEHASICGRGYMMPISDTESGDNDEAPYEYLVLDPENTFVIREAKLTHKILIGVSYYKDVIIDEKTNQEVPVTIFDVRTKYHRYLYKTTGQTISQQDIVSGFPKVINLPICPIVEYRNNQFMLGDFEVVIGILNSINLLETNSLEDVDAFVQAFLVFLNVDFGEDKDETLAQIKKDKAFCLRDSSTSQRADAKFISNQLNAEGTKNLRDSLLEHLMRITAIPERFGSPGGSPTGQGVRLGYGYPSQENASKPKDAAWYEAERDMIKLILDILHKRGLVLDLKSRDITPVINRTLFENAQSRAQVAQLLVAMKLISPDTALRIAKIETDLAQIISEGKEFWGNEWGRPEKGVSAQKDIEPELATQVAID
jgi:SPP1 family phage portal protein